VSIRSVLKIRSTIPEFIESAFRVSRNSHRAVVVVVQDLFRPVPESLYEKYGKNTAFSTTSFMVPKPHDDVLT